MLRQLILCGVGALAMLAGESRAQAQTSASQTYSVVIPSVMSITAPGGVSINHDQTDANQAFPSQGWSAKCNNGLGATVSFSTNGPFQASVAGTTYKRNAQMNLSVGSAESGSGWATVVSSATATPDVGVATVSAASSAPGNATLNLLVTFIDNHFSLLPAGTFTTTVTATIAAN